MNRYGVLLLAVFYINTAAFSTPDEPDSLHIRKVFEVDSCEFKLGITRCAEWEYKIHISKKINGKWQLQNRHIRHTDFFKSYQLDDWNKDGFTDIRIGFTNGMAAESDSYLFIYDTVQKKYHNIENFSHYCGSYEPEKSITPTSPYHFCITKAGCAGSMNRSYFYTVVNFHIRLIASMILNECDEPFQLIIYKHDCDNKRIPVSTISMDYINQHYESAFDYAAHYWTKHGTTLITACP